MSIICTIVVMYFKRYVVVLLYIADEHSSNFWRAFTLYNIKIQLPVVWNVVEEVKLLMHNVF